MHYTNYAHVLYWCTYTIVDYAHAVEFYVLCHLICTHTRTHARTHTHTHVTPLLHGLLHKHTPIVNNTNPLSVYYTKTHTTYVYTVHVSTNLSVYLCSDVGTANNSCTLQRFVSCRGTGLATQQHQTGHL